jgi:hypothetical protein
MKQVMIAVLLLLAYRVHALVISVGYDVAGLAMTGELVSPSVNAVNVASGGIGIDFMNELGESYCLLVTLGANAFPFFVMIGGSNVDPGLYTIFAMADCSVTFGYVLDLPVGIRLCTGLGIDGALVATPWGEDDWNASDVYGISVGIGATAELLWAINETAIFFLCTRAYPCFMLYFLEDEYAGIQPGLRWGVTIGFGFTV